MSIYKNKIVSMLSVWIVIICISLIYIAALSKKELVLITVAFMIPAFQHAWFDTKPCYNRAFFAVSVIALDSIVLFFSKMQILNALHIANGEAYLTTVASGLSILPLFFLAVLSTEVPNLPLLILKQSGAILTMQDLLGYIPFMIRGSLLMTFIGLDLKYST